MIRIQPIDWAAIAQGYTDRLTLEASHLTMEDADFLMACRRYAEQRIATPPAPAPEV